MQIQTDLIESCSALDINTGGLLYTLIETLAIKLSDTESAIENMIGGLDPSTCSPEILVALAANIGLYPFAKLAPVISVPVSDDINLEEGNMVYIDEDNAIIATVSNIEGEKIYLELREAGQEIQNKLMDLINNNNIVIKTFSVPIQTYRPESVSLERAGREAETHESFRARYLSNTRVSPFGGNLAYVMELIQKYDSEMVKTYSKPNLSYDKMLCTEVYIARPDVEGVDAPEPLKSTEYAFLERTINEGCGIGVSISCKKPLIVPPQNKKLQITVEMAHGQNIPEDKIIMIAQRYCYNNIHNFKCEPLNLYNLSKYIQGRMSEHGIIDVNITTHDNREIIVPNKDEWCIVHRNNVEFHRVY